MTLIPVLIFPVTKNPQINRRTSILHLQFLLYMQKFYNVNHSNLFNIACPFIQKNLHPSFEPDFILPYQNLCNRCDCNRCVSAVRLAARHCSPETVHPSNGCHEPHDSCCVYSLRLFAPALSTKGL